MSTCLGTGCIEVLQIHDAVESFHLVVCASAFLSFCRDDNTKLRPIIVWRKGIGTREPIAGAWHYLTT